jgi:hypothetical protein
MLSEYAIIVLLTIKSITGKYRAIYHCLSLSLSHHRDKLIGFDSYFRIGFCIVFYLFIYSLIYDMI